MPSVKSKFPPKPDLSTKKSRIPDTESVEDPRFVFSLRYWQQIDHFGLSSCSMHWYVSVLERLRDMSALSIDDLRTNHALKDHMRFHEINWSQRNIPLKPDDLKWLPKQVRENQEEFPLMQFQLSKATGRIIGYFDEKDIFCIVLLDPLHNMQPSKKQNYVVNPTNPQLSEYQLLLSKMHLIQKDFEQSCGMKNDNCELALQICTFFEDNPPEFGHVMLSEVQLGRIYSLLKDHKEFMSVDCVVEAALNMLIPPIRL